MSMVEKVARAIHLKRNGAGCTPWSRLPKSHQAPYLSDARAAIAAMREPSEGMVEAAGTGSFSPTFAAMWPTIASGIFTAMIDQALKEGEG